MKPPSKIKTSSFVNETPVPIVNLDMVACSTPEETDNDPFITELENVLREMEKEDDEE